MDPLILPPAMSKSQGRLGPSALVRQPVSEKGNSESKRVKLRFKKWPCVTSFPGGRVDKYMHHFDDKVDQFLSGFNLLMRHDKRLFQVFYILNVTQEILLPPSRFIISWKTSNNNKNNNNKANKWSLCLAKYVCWNKNSDTTLPSMLKTQN